MKTPWKKNHVYHAEFEGRDITIVIDLLGGGVGLVEEWLIFWGQVDDVKEEVADQVTDLATRDKIEAEVSSGLQYDWVEAYDHYVLDSWA